MAKYISSAVVCSISHVFDLGPVILSSSSSFYCGLSRSEAAPLSMVFPGSNGRIGHLVGDMLASSEGMDEVVSTMKEAQ